MLELNFPPYPFRFKSRENKRLVFDIIRKKYVVLQPEEWVRQHCLHFLTSDLGYSKSLILVEKEILVSGLKKRVDIAVCRPDGSIYLLVECKAPEIPISQNTFDQIARYNLQAASEYLMVTNGLQHYYCQMDFESQSYHFLEKLPMATPPSI